MTRIGIHIGSIHPERMRCIASQIEAYGQFDVWITDSNWREHFDVMCADIGFTPAMATTAHLPGIVQIADWLRFWHASKTPDMLWCDTDLEVLDPLWIGGLKKNVPYHGHSRNEAYDYYYFYVNNACWWYKRGLEYMIANADRRCPALNYVHNPENSRHLTPIRQETFRHWAFDPEHEEQHWQKVLI